MDWPARLPRVNLFLIGGAKCGTTTLAHYLERQEGGVCLARPKEPWFFGQEDMGSRWIRQGGMQWYASCFSHWRGEPWVCDASTSYLRSETAVDAILKFNPDARFLVILRNPFEVIPSLFLQMILNGQESRHSFTQVLANPDTVPLKCQNANFVDYLSWVLWGKQLERIKRHVREERALVLLFDELFGSGTFPKAELESFLGLELQGAPADMHLNRGHGYGAMRLWADNMLGTMAGASLRLGATPVFKAFHKMRVFSLEGKNKPDWQGVGPEWRKRISEDLMLLAEILPRKRSLILSWLDAEEHL